MEINETPTMIPDILSIERGYKEPAINRQINTVGAIFVQKKFDLNNILI